MTEFKFEGEFDTLSDSQLKLVESVLQKQGFTNGKVRVEPVGQKGDNYVANVKRFIYERSDGSLFKMIGKVAPVGEELRKMMSTALLFINEIVLYQETLPKFINLQNSAGVPANERIRFPICYGAISEAPYEMILLEDLTEAGFEMLNRFEPLPNAAVRLVLKDLATFHSLSYALKNSEPETYKNIASKLLNMFSIMDAEPAAKMFFEKTENEMKTLLDSETRKKVITGSLSQLTLHAKKNESYEKSSKYSVIQQGDCWSNNVLFKLEAGTPVENVMIDYQLSRESNPAADILYCILNCTDYDSRAKYYHEWIDYYHEILDNSLANYGLTANRIFPRDQLDADLRRYGKMMLSFGIMLSGMIVREAKDVVDMKEMESADKEEIIDTAMTQMTSSNLDNTTVVKLKQRVEGIIDSVLEFGLV